jgi:hypothetical protein
VPRGGEKRVWSGSWLFRGFDMGRWIPGALGA